MTTAIAAARARLRARLDNNHPLAQQMDLLGEIQQRTGLAVGLAVEGGLYRVTNTYKEGRRTVTNELTPALSWGEAMDYARSILANGGLH